MTCKSALAVSLGRILAVPEPCAFICRFGLATGLRWGELVRACWTDVHDGVLIVHQTKSTRLRRVPLPTSLLEELRFKVGRLLPIRNVRREAEPRAGEVASKRR